jgi:hypothetical protein
VDEQREASCVRTLVEERLQSPRDAALFRQPAEIPCERHQARLGDSEFSQPEEGRPRFERDPAGVAAARAFNIIRSPRSLASSTSLLSSSKGLRPS